MARHLTPLYSWEFPEDGADVDIWGPVNYIAFDLIDAQVWENEHTVINSFGTTTTLTAVHLGRFIRGTAAITFDLTAAASLGTDWWCYIKADGGVVTVDPAGAETIDGSATLTVLDGTSIIIFTDGSNWFTSGDLSD